MCAYNDFEMYQDDFDNLTRIETVTVEYSTATGNYYITGIEFRPITPHIVNVYHEGRFLGDIAADDQREFERALVELIECRF